MSDLTITRERNGNRGEYRASSADGGVSGHLTWFESSPGVRVADHTLVPGHLQGKGIAAKLVEALIADARSEGFRIVPQCSYVAVAFRRHPEWADLRA
ncbi:MAG: GNAT family N-acetyltransferase [Novosphingobium sp.]